MTSLLVTVDIDIGGVAILAVAGSLVADAGDRLAAVVSAALQELGPIRLVVDLARVDDAMTPRSRCCCGAGRPPCGPASRSG